METYLVGGAVRDKLLGVPVKERDWVVVGATPEAMTAAGFRQVGKDFPVFLHPETGEEYALARTERKTAPGYTGFEVHATPEVTLEQDLERRDLTINAMAEDSEGRLIDPFNGEQDLREGVLRHVSPAFAEDPVRILRVARFAARFGKWGFRVAHSTNALMRKMVRAGEVDALVPERVWAETEKALAEDTPERFFEVLRGCGALAKVFPELDAQFEQAGTGGHADTRPADTVPALRALRQAVALSTDGADRFAALSYRLGPSDADAAQCNRVIETLCERLRAPNEFRERAVLAARYHKQCHQARTADGAALLALLEALDAFRRGERFEHLVLICQAIARAEDVEGAETYSQAQRLRRARQAAVAVDASRFVEQGLTGSAIGERLRDERVRAIEEAVAG